MQPGHDPAPRRGNAGVLPPVPGVDRDQGHLFPRGGGSRCPGRLPGNADPRGRAHGRPPRRHRPKGGLEPGPARDEDASVDSCRRLESGYYLRGAGRGGARRRGYQQRRGNGAREKRSGKNAGDHRAHPPQRSVDGENGGRIPPYWTAVSDWQTTSSKVKKSLPLDGGET